MGAPWFRLVWSWRFTHVPVGDGHILGQQMLDSLSPVFILSQRAFFTVLLPVPSLSLTVCFASGKHVISIFNVMGVHYVAAWDVLP